MAASTYRLADEHSESVEARAAEEGFQLVQFETTSGQLVWEWRRGNEPKPQFVNRRIALHYMDDLLNRIHTAASDRLRSSDLRSVRAMSQRARRIDS